ncbi:hypothetical protein KM1_325280 [Entamoeba histolytica HM-3:IMSS]|uniref:Uncharacterized protein n=4 Tax=Entamoeba histolytica TaxID=5759 RepID=C4M3U6_ENTH1|nr:hypothetical protein EHI_163660 [Entamoeba histolytica HM-1:IMSS]EAL48338.1 hypothetical protein EHI_163660 [Entamoeba histolytica HM-1:IMSS]EMD48377.1 Hypothetical protein EHI5A_091460 [Entamoeba histolytica KU27]EMS13259.1 hypothetical protein KM1_325280 [Entamoeba histolytica HM-3:IMSS]GAT96011.1 hypothetical protein CL6EHI_163660 [Entamoeba histolytica]|eukprot:XP_653726.1 hypothetical protein EHI_163660 [Entamoeba histolytica HM-1:IMSS]
MGKIKKRCVLEQFYMMTVAMYLYDFDSLKLFCCVNKKCEGATSNLKINPNFQDSLYYRSKCTLKQRTKLFEKELKFFDHIDTLRGSFSMISSFPLEKIKNYPLFDIFHEGCGSNDLFKEIQPKITSLEFIFNGRFEGTAYMPLLKKLKVMFLNDTNSLTSLHFHVNSLTSLLSQKTIGSLNHFIIICFMLDDCFLPLLQTVQSVHQSCQIAICVKGSVSISVAKKFTPFATIIQTSKEAMFYGELDKELRVVALQEIH